MTNQLSAASSTAPNPDLCVFIGRFQPLHEGHQRVIREGLSRAKFMVVLVGSANEPRTPRNPFTADERAALIKQSFHDDPRLVVLPLEDSDYNIDDWLERTHATVDAAWSQVKSQFPGAPRDPSVALIGHAKDATSYYLDLFPRWGSIDVAQEHVMCATTIRNELFGCKSDAIALLEARDEAIAKGLRQPMQAYFNDYTTLAHARASVFLDHQQDLLENDTADMAAPVIRFLRAFIDSPDYSALCAEYAFAFRNKFIWRHAPHAYIAQTADAVIIQSGHVLMLKRNSYPGKGLWALPGGYVEEFEEPLDAALRELDEEVGLKVPPRVLLGHLKGSKRFSAPHRSFRGRVITEGFYFHLDPGPLPKTKKLRPEGDEEAGDIAWVHLSKLRRDKCFEDHYAIIRSQPPQS